MNAHINAHMNTTPEKIGKYKIESLIARGGMGAVYKAIHPELKRPVIIKKLTIRGNSAIAERFKREAKILLDLNNPHIVHLHDYFHEGSARYLVLEFVDGMSLDVLLKRKTSFSAEMALVIILEVCMALKYAHDRGIVHRDIKPGNILISRKGEIKLADFGIAASDAILSENDEISVSDELLSSLSKAPVHQQKDLTLAGSMLGTPSYMPPEQFADSSSVDNRCDIYAVGVMLYEMIAGEKPFQGGFTPETVEKIKKGVYPSISKKKKNLPSIIQTLLHKMIRNKPSKRFKDLSVVIKMIRRYLSQYDVRDIRFNLVKNMLTNETTEPVFEKKKNTAQKILFIFFLLIVTSVAGYFLWSNGYIHQYVLRPWYAPVRIHVRLPKAEQDSVLDSSGLQFRAFFFIDNDADIPEIIGSRTILALSPRATDVLELHSKKIWLRPGAYRLKLVAGPRIWWYTFLLEKDGLVLTPRFGATTIRALNVRSRAFDSMTGIDISKNAVFSVLINGKWVPLSEAIPTLSTGSIIKIRVESKGYTSREFSLKIGWYQDELMLDAGLIPLP